MKQEDAKPGVKVLVTNVINDGTIEAFPQYKHLIDATGIIKKVDGDWGMIEVEFNDNVTCAFWSEELEIKD